MKNTLLALCVVSSAFADKVLIYGGKTGWIGQKLVSLFPEDEVVCGNARLENRTDLENEILEIMPDFIINAAGVTGRPNVDWCETHQTETIRSNIVGPLNLADISNSLGIHMTNLGTGCIYEYDEEHPIGGKGFTEQDPPNFAGSFYSKTKIYLNDMLESYPNVLNLRLRMPISDDLHERSFITKISRYKKVINVPNSMTILHDLLPLIPQMVNRRLSGHYNFVNPGTMSHNEILDLYREYIDPEFTYENFSIEEQNQILLSKRSNNCMDTTKLEEQFPDVADIRSSMRKLFERMSQR
jgi:dTDP-4-dehydrorhamnose reductase